MTDLQREKEIEAEVATSKQKLLPCYTTMLIETDDIDYLLAELKDERSKLSDYAAAADALIWKVRENLGAANERLSAALRAAGNRWHRNRIDHCPGYPTYTRTVEGI